MHPNDLVPGLIASVTIRTITKTPLIAFGTYNITSDKVLFSINEVIKLTCSYPNTTEYYQNEVEIGIAIMGARYQGRRCSSRRS